MIPVISYPLELRGVQTKTSAKGKTYYVLNVENGDGVPQALYCPDVNALPKGLNKGDSITVSFNLFSYNGQERYTVTKVERVEK